MKVLMLGWEYPPHISGGLGTACQGLTTALAGAGVSIDFVVPRVYGTEDAGHMRLVAADTPAPRPPPGTVDGPIHFVLGARGVEVSVSQPEVHVVQIPALLAPYVAPEHYDRVTWALERGVDPWSVEALAAFPEGDPASGRVPMSSVTALPVESPGPEMPWHAPGSHYGYDLFEEVERYARKVTSYARHGDYDVIHAHDWMTFPAGMAMSHVTGRPLVVHVHSLEQDRSGGWGNDAIVAVERAGLQAAQRIVAVSHYTRQQIHRVHGIPLDKIEVVHNGVYAPRTVTEYRKAEELEGPVVLFLGRVTMQKGPEYFVEAAARVRELVPNARFIVAGTGDLLPRIKEQVHERGLSSSFQFPGFVRGPEVERMFSVADVYVMPSVSEPFGISALEAMSYDTPVILSRQSGVSEVLRHALKVDFWDTEKLASQIVAVLTYPELRESIVAMAREEVRRLHWDRAAEKTTRVYESVLSHRGPALS